MAIHSSNALTLAEWAKRLDPNGKIMDGMHRICKALNLGHKNIMARQLAHLPQPDFVGVPENELPY